MTGGLPESGLCTNVRDVCILLHADFKLIYLPIKLLHYWRFAQVGGLRVTYIYNNNQPEAQESRLQAIEMRDLKRVEGVTKLDRVGNADIADKGCNRKHACSYRSSPKEAVSMEGESRWYGRGKTDEACAQQGDELQKTKRKTKKVLDRQL